MIEKFGLTLLQSFKLETRVDLGPIDRIAHLQRQVLAQRHAGFQVRSIAGAAVRKIRARQCLAREQIDTGGDALVEE